MKQFPANYKQYSCNGFYMNQVLPVISSVVDDVMKFT